MTRPEQAARAFRKGLNCAQAILQTYGPDLGLDAETGRALGLGFEGGMGCTGRTCGAVTGALMVLGLLVARVEGRVKRRAERANALAQDFLKRFEAKCRSSRCRALLRIDISTPEGKQEALKSGLFATLCPELVAEAAGVLEEMLAEVRGETADAGTVPSPKGARG